VNGRLVAAHRHERLLVHRRDPRRVEMAEAGYAAVAEFHYLHHRPGGAPYADLAEMSGRIVAAAAETGLGLTLLPVLYERAGFAQPALRDDQRRFATDLHTVLRWREAMAQRPSMTL
jgi:formimidoylglutamate deiminase